MLLTGLHRNEPLRAVELRAVLGFWRVAPSDDVTAYSQSYGQMLGQRLGLHVSEHKHTTVVHGLMQY